MDDKDLSAYIPAFGDRVNLRSLCKPNNDKKTALFDKLRKKMKLSPNESDSEKRPTRSMNLRGNKNAQKINRKIELGWMHDGKHIRTNNGGGSRKIELHRESRKADILKEAKTIFFPNGKSKKNILLSSVKCKVLDFAQTEFDDNITIAEMYDTVKMGMLRFHLCTENNSAKRNPPELAEDVHSDDSLPDIDPIILGKEEHFIGPAAVFDEEGSTLVVPTYSPDATSVVPKFSTEAISDVPTYNPEVTSVVPAYIPEVTSVMPTYIPEVTSTYPLDGTSDVATSPSEIECVTFSIHRIKVLDELIALFKSPHISTNPIEFAFINEAGADQAGVSRDVYSSFWSDFFSRVAEGEDYRVPAINPHWQEEEWKSLGRILVKGLLDHNMFPLTFAPAFISAVLFGEHSVCQETLLNSFLLYLNKTERDLVKTALERKLSADEKEDFLEMIDRFGSKIIPTMENMREEVLKMAHKEIIQKPKYALEKIAEICRSEITVQIPNEESLMEMYEAKKPTIKKVLRMISHVNPVTPAENQCLQFFKQYIKAQESQKSLEKLLRFMTGTDIICVEKIEVTFVKLVGLGRRPIAHTCAPALELPSTYLSYIELRHEFDSVLSSGDYCMEMHIV